MEINKLVRCYYFNNNNNDKWFIRKMAAVRLKIYTLQSIQRLISIKSKKWELTVLFVNEGVGGECWCRTLVLATWGGMEEGIVGLCEGSCGRQQDVNSHVSVRIL